MFGKADPYVLVKLADQKIKSKTVCVPSFTPSHYCSQVDNSQNPEWDFTANVNYTGDPGLQLVIEVHDDDIGKDDLLGSTAISMMGILQSQVGRAGEGQLRPRQGFVDKWFTLEGVKSGEVQVSVQCLAAISRDSSRSASVASKVSSKPVSKENSRTASLKSLKSVDIIAEEAIAPGKITLTVHRAKKLEKKVSPLPADWWLRPAGDVRRQGGPLLPGHPGQAAGPLPDRRQQPGH
jgi:hypothetical protein